MKKFIISFGLVIALLITSTPSYNANAAATADFIKENTQAFLSILSEDEYEINDIETLFTLEEKICGFNVDFVNLSTKKTGYINFSSDGNVIEYSLDSAGSLFNKYDKVKKYYNGDLEYFFKKDNKLVSSVDGKKYEKNNVKQNKKIKSVEGSGNIIYTPSNYVNNIISSDFEDIPNYNLNYVRTSNFTNDNAYLSGYQTYDNHCAPTAVLNCIIYWENNGYPDMLTYSHPYSTEFDTICILMQFDNTGAFRDQYEDAYLDYANISYPNFHSAEDLYITHSDIYARVAEDIPFIYGINNHSVYGDHAVVGLGYNKIVYWYPGIFPWIHINEELCFIRIADGWSGAANRYINYKDASIRDIVWIS